MQTLEKNISRRVTLVMRPEIVFFLFKNKTRTSNVGAISKAQKAQNIFCKKLEIFEIFFGKCRELPKNVKRCPFGIF